MAKKFFASVFGTFSLFLVVLQLSVYAFFLLSTSFSIDVEMSLLIAGFIFYSIVLGIPLAFIGFLLDYPHYPSYLALKIHLIIVAASPIFAVGYLLLN
ncbi:hypothetical protein SAMN05444392_10576 [Seinonella peptonophila]|uniref:Uncharacterized protein n=1 Tax=Seinonella peptonophila TaxID=112248 RepID=A0A1M4XLZ6_9BACL|nr:hypothetical protein [Seinonella peptonophila]SHE94627.1 hypothetical protein SAMN05444392_10576 [Seinonella peptonophila]